MTDSKRAASGPAELWYAGKFSGVRLPLAQAAVTGRPADPRVIAELAAAQEPAIASVSPALHELVYGVGIDEVLRRGEPESFAIVEAYARKAGRPPQNERMVPPAYFVAGSGDAQFGYDNRPAGARHYTNVETLRRALSGIPDIERAAVVTTLLHVQTRDGAFLPTPVGVSSSFGGNVLLVFENVGANMFPGISADTPVAALTSRGPASSHAGTFGTFGGAASYSKDIDPTTGRISILGSKEGRSTSSRELMEESTTASSETYERAWILAQQDLQLSTGAIEVIGNRTFDDAVAQVRRSPDRTEFDRARPVVPVPVDLAYLTAVACSPALVDGTEVFRERLPSWAALEVVGLAEARLGAEAASVLAARMRTPEAMREAHADLQRNSPEVLESLTAAMTSETLRIAV